MSTTAKANVLLAHATTHQSAPRNPRSHDAMIGTARKYANRGLRIPPLKRDNIRSEGPGEDQVEQAGAPKKSEAKHNQRTKRNQYLDDSADDPLWRMRVQRQQNGRPRPKPQGEAQQEGVERLRRGILRQGPRRRRA